MESRECVPRNSTPSALVQVVNNAAVCLPLFSQRTSEEEKARATLAVNYYGTRDMYGGIFGYRMNFAENRLEVDVLP